MTPTAPQPTAPQHATEPRPTVVVLAAGFGRRLGGTVPKALVELVDGRTILRQQLDNLRAVLPEPAVHVVVGHKAHLVLEAQPDVLFVYNDAFEVTNTAKSLLRALELCPDGDVLWLNGDVVFHPEVLTRLVEVGSTGTSCVAVDRSSVGAEEVKYALDADGWVGELSKEVARPVGEAVGLNHVAAADRPALAARLRQAADDDYFERAVELTIEHDGARWRPVDVTDLYAVEIDFPEDLVRANALLGGADAAPAP